MNHRKIYFTPGPSALYFTVEEHVRTALKRQIPSISHRGQEFSKIYQKTDQGLRELVGLPEDYCIFFTGSATEVWERMLQAAVKTDTLHLVNGAFSKRFSTVAAQLGYNGKSLVVPAGQVVTMDQLPDDYQPELVGVTHNETSTGASQPLDDLITIRNKYPDSLIAVDVVSSLPIVALPFDKVDSAYFSVQKCFGLPSGLGVWLVNKRFIEKSQQIGPTGRTSYHGIDSFLAKYQKHQTPATPNVLSIYLLGRVVQDMLEKGLDRIRMESRYKSALLYHFLESKSNLKPFVTEKSWRSETIIVAQTGIQTGSLVKSLAEKGLVVGRGYGDFKDQNLRIANFPTHSKEQIEMLVDVMDGLVE
jgi:phosphoserine aminotransferase